ncbi:hypothetical protein UFOVP655_93 [uncultured Caudovirales phage]|uniref:Uncharacterized protein n=1 Tax=uncultured Caudovirales phage TaxID=2100421 RepID=A0A6J5NAA9_9CAUD|nr:hypothetical protein UFOVP655_93 [uncultured Caudovirales phage]
MALGTSLTTVTLSGNYVDFEGNAIAGQVRFSISQVLRNPTDDQLVAPSNVVVPLVNGSFTVTLPATNDPDVFPNPFVYTVEESFPNGRTYSISVPYTASGTLDLADISPDPELTTEYVQLVDKTNWDVLAANIDALDLLIDQSTDTFPASGQYWYISSGYDTYTAIDTAFSTYSSLTSATYNISGADITEFVTSAQGYATSASNSATTAQNTAAGTISPLLLIGG